MTKYPIFKVHIDKEAALKELDVVLGSGFLNEGEQVTRLTKAMSDYLQHDHVVLLNSGTSALTLALKLAGVRNGDTVLATSMTCVASNTPIYASGARIVWIDINRETGNIDTEKLEEYMCYGNMVNVRALLCVDWAGFPCDLDRIMTLCDKYGIKFIQDAAHAFGATYNGRHVCHTAHFTCYSLQAIKHITCGDGGILVCKDEADFKRAKKLKWFGIDREATKDAKGEWKGQRWEVDIEESGFKYHMNNISAAIGLSQLPYIENIVETHRYNADSYNLIFEHHPDVRPLKLPSTPCNPSYWVYTALLNPDIDRDKVLEYMKDRKSVV